MLSGGLSLQWLEAGPGFPARDRGWVTAMKAPNLAIRSVVRDKGSGPEALQKGISTKEVVKQMKYLLGGKRVQYLWIDTWADSKGESLSCALMAV